MFVKVCFIRGYGWDFHMENHCTLNKNVATFTVDQIQMFQPDGSTGSLKSMVYASFVEIKTMILRQCISVICVDFDSKNAFQSYQENPICHFPCHYLV